MKTGNLPIASWLNLRYPIAPSAWSSQFSKTGTQTDVNLQDLLEDLRKNLRKELGLGEIGNKIHHVKFTLASDANKESGGSK